MCIAKTQSEQMLDIRNQYTAKGGNEYTIDELVDFAISNHMWEIDVAGTKQQLAAQLRRALNGEEFTDPQGRKIRRNYAASVTRHGRQMFLWTDMPHASREHMKVSLYDNRRRIYGDCRRLKEYIDSYNQNYNSGEPIQMSFDFTRDLREAELATGKMKITQKTSPSVSVLPSQRFPVAAQGTISRRVISRP